MEEVTVIIPTYKRLDGLLRIMRSISETSKGFAYKRLVIIDNDDLETYNFCTALNLDCILSNSHNDFVKQMNVAISACETPYILKVDDDMEVVEDNLIERSLRVYKEKFPDNNGLLCYNDGIQNGAVFTAGMFSKKLVHELGGHLYYPKYRHYGGDRELVRLTKEIGCYFYDKSLSILHHHHSKEGIKKDSTYQISEDKFWKTDQALKRYRRDNVDLIKERNYCDYL